MKFINSSVAALLCLVVVTVNAETGIKRANKLRGRKNKELDSQFETLIEHTNLHAIADASAESRSAFVGTRHLSESGGGAAKKKSYACSSKKASENTKTASAKERDYKTSSSNVQSDHSYSKSTTTVVYLDAKKSSEAGGGSAKEPGENKEGGNCREANSALRLQGDVFSTPKNQAIAVQPEQILVNDVHDGDGDLLIESYGEPRNGTLVMFDEGDGFTYIPDRGFEGTDFIDYVVIDGVNEGENVATITIIVGDAGNIAPIPMDDQYDMTKGSVLTVVGDDILSNDMDYDGDDLSIVGFTQPENGVVVQNDDGGFSYIPNDGFEGYDVFEYTVTDGINESTALITVSVFNPNEGPTAVDDILIIDAGSVVFRFTPDDLKVNDIDGYGEGLEIIEYTQPGFGLLTSIPNGGFLFLPQGNLGTTTFTYTVMDPDGKFDTATVTIDINAGNRAPEGNDDTFPVIEGDALVIPAPGLLVNDYDPDGDEIFVCGISSPSNGELTVQPDGSFSYTPNSGFTGIDQFTYDVCDENGGKSTSTVYLDVLASNQHPDAVDDVYTATKGEVFTVTGPGILGNDKDPENDPITVVSHTQISNGDVTVSPDGSFVYVPNDFFTGVDSFTYTVNDSEGGSDTATVYIYIVDDNNDPQPHDDVYQTPQDTKLIIASPDLGLLNNDEDPDGDGLTIIENTDAKNGAVDVGPDGTFVYTPAEGFVGIDTFQYTVSDGQGGTKIGTVTINILAGNVAPDINNDVYSAVAGLPMSISAPGILENDKDEDGDTLTVVDNTFPSNGQLSVDSDGSFVYTANDNFVGVDKFEYTVIDGFGGTGKATVFINVVAGKQGPEANDDVYMATGNQALSIQVPGLLENDKDPEGRGLVVRDDYTTPSNGAVSVNTDGSFVYVPEDGFVGLDEFDYTIADVNGVVAGATVFINVVDGNGEPVANDDTYTAVAGNDLMISAPGLLDNDIDADGNDIFIIGNTQPNQNGQLLVNPDGSIVYTPVTGFIGVDTFTYTISDGKATSTATVNINVAAAPEPPVANRDDYIGEKNTPLTVSAAEGALVNDSSPSGLNFQVQSNKNPRFGVASMNPDGSFTYTPSLNYLGTDSFKYFIVDENGNTDTARVFIQIVNRGGPSAGTSSDCGNNFSNCTGVDTISEADGGFGNEGSGLSGFEFKGGD